MKPAGNTQSTGKKAPVQNNGADSRIVVVLGMHRSGTSALAAALSDMGLEMGNSLLPSAEDNPAGFYEDQRVVSINQKLLASLGSSWEDYGALPDGWQESAAADEARANLAAVLRELASPGRVFAVKDPRICRLLPLWRRVMAELRLRPGYLLSVRHPLEVARSLQKRDGLTEFRSRMLWLDHLLSAEAGSRDGSRAFLEYEQLVRDPRQVIAAAFSTLGNGFEDLAIAAETSDIDKVDASLRHHEHTQDPGDQLLREVYRASREAASTGVADEAAFDGFLRAFEAERGMASRSREDERQTQKTGLGLLQIASLREIVSLQSTFELGVKLPRPVQPRTYLRAPDGMYSEDEASDGFAIDAAKTRFRFEPRLVREQVVGFIRIDPDITSGYFSVSSVKIGNQTLSGISQRVAASSERRMGAPEGAVVVCAKGMDPWVELDVRDMFLTGGDCEAIEVTVVAHSVSSMLLEAYERLVGIHESDEAVRLEVAEATNSIQANLRSRFDQADVRIAAVAERIGRLHGDVQAGLSAAVEAIARAAAKEAEQAALGSAALERAEARSAELFARLDVLAEGIRQWTGDAVQLAAQSAAESAAQAQARTLEVRSELLASMKHAQDQALVVLKKTEQLESSLQSLQQTQDVLLRFAERRSFRYWMGRLFGGRK